MAMVNVYKKEESETNKELIHVEEYHISPYTSSSYINSNILLSICFHYSFCSPNTIINLTSNTTNNPSNNINIEDRQLVLIEEIDVINRYVLMLLCSTVNHDKIQLPCQIMYRLKIVNMFLINSVQIIRLDLVLTILILCVRDCIREYTSSYTMISISNPILCVVFIFSEILFFLTFFWSSFHCSCSVGINQPISAGFYEPDPNDLTYTNTVLLSNSGISLSVG
jgi:hypothetical protein